MRFFQFNGKFPEFTGTVIGSGEKIGDLTLPHQIVKNGKPDPILIATDTSLVPWTKQLNERGKDIKFTSGTREKRYTRMIITAPLYIDGKVKMVGSFGFGQKIFFTNLLVDVGREDINIAFRPFPSEKRTAGQELMHKKIILENDTLYVIKGGEKVPWKYHAR